MAFTDGRLYNLVENLAQNQNPVDKVAISLQQDALQRDNIPEPGLDTSPETQRVAGPAERIGSLALESTGITVDDHAIELVFNQCYKRLVRMAMFLVGPEAAHDVAEDAIAGMANLPTYDRSLLNFAHRAVILRSRLESTQVPEATEEPSDVVDSLRWLPPDQREVVVLRYFADLSDADIADATGIALVNVNKYAATGMNTIRPILATH